MTSLEIPPVEALTIRTATEEDVPAVERCVKACGKWVATYFDLHDREEFYELDQCWIATDDTAVAAFAIAVPLKRSNVTSLYEFGVHPLFRGQGLGRKLLKLAAVGRPIRLVVDAENGQAAMFYMRAGLRITGSRRVKTGNRLVYTMEGEPC